MKKLFIFSFILISFLSCNNDPTPPLPPTVTTGDATNIGNYGANVSVFITQKTKEIGVLYSTSSNITLSNAKREIISYSDNSTVYGLTAGTTYYYKAYATNGTDYVYGQVKSFTTTTTIARVLTGTGSSTGYYSSYYHFSLNIYVWGLDQISEWGNQISRTRNNDFTNPVVGSITASNYVEGTAYSHGPWQTTSTGIQYYRAYAKLKDGTYIYGEIKSVNVTY